ncbi:MAG TPA: GNAT family N-acetyltransferase [Candidatus Binatia bacterium]
MIIRVARIEDAAVLTKAEQDTAQIPGLLVSRPHELTTESFAAKITELATLGRYIVAENNERIIGHALLDPMRLEATAHIFRLTIVVHSGFQNRGVGEALMRDLMNWAKQAPNLRKIELLVRATNERAIRLYFRMGFIEEGRFRERVGLVNGGFVDDLAMAWFPR